MKKTAMWEYLDKLNEEYNDPLTVNRVKDGLRMAIDIAMNQLKSLDKERQQIIDAYKDGYNNGNIDTCLGSEQYYSQRYLNK